MLEDLFAFPLASKTLRPNLSAHSMPADFVLISLPLPLLNLFVFGLSAT
jgi:hypothetical protein